MKKDFHKINILGIELSTGDKDFFRDNIKNALKNKRQLFITTPNPEIILSSQIDEKYHYILNSADLSIADGVGLVWASLFMGDRVNRWPGSDISLELLAGAEKDNYRVAIINLLGGLSSKANIQKSLKTKYKNLDFKIFETNKDFDDFNINDLLDYKANILFVTLGAKAQEKFIYKYKSQLLDTQIFIGVGGSFDYITGKVKNTPKMLKKYGLEWFWRLIHIFSFSKPLKRLKRIFRAIVVFPAKFLKWRFYNPLVYRKNVACMLYKYENNKYYVLVLERQDEKDHWQLPQGGRDGESLKIAGRHELEEELGTNKFTIKATYPNLYRYSYPKKIFSKYKHRNYKGQSQGLLIAEYTGDSSEIQIEKYEHSLWRWIEIDNFIDTVHQARKESSEIFIKKFKELIK